MAPDAAAPSGAPPVSVVINTVDRAASLERCLEALDLVEYAPLEVVVVNGPSTDGTADVLTRWADRIKVGSCPERNLSRSRNVGLRLSAGHIVAFIDDDAYPHPRWLAELVPLFDDPEVAAGGGPVMDHTGGRLQAGVSLADRFGHAESWECGDPSPYLSSPWSERFVYPIGTNCLVRRSAAVAVGGFDEEYEYHLDETDLARRLLDAAWVVRPGERGVVYHKYLPSDQRGDNRAFRTRRSFLKNTSYFAWRHARASHDREAIDRWLADYVERHRRDVQACVRDGALPQEAVEALELEVAEAIPIGRDRALAGAPRVRPPGWFDERPAPWHPFGSSAERRRQVVVIDRVPLWEEQDEVVAARFDEHAAGDRAEHRRVIVPGAGHDRLDLYGRTWLHRRADGDLVAALADSLRHHHPVDRILLAPSAADLAPLLRTLHGTCVELG